MTDAKKIAVWEITEPESFFLEALEVKSNPELGNKRQMEKLSCGYLLNYLTGENYYNFLTNDQNGKPFIINSSFSVSFSHSKNRIACVVDKTGKAVGIDIEEIRERISTLSHKFVSASDISPETGIHHQHLIWGAKEVLYKIYSKKELDFIKHLQIDYQGDIIGHINKNEYFESYVLDYLVLDNFMLVWNI